jgi:hypothetical protein
MKMTLTTTIQQDLILDDETINELTLVYLAKKYNNEELDFDDLKKEDFEKEKENFCKLIAKKHEMGKLNIETLFGEDFDGWDEIVQETIINKKFNLEIKKTC